MSLFIHCTVPAPIQKMIARRAELLAIVNADDSDGIAAEQYDIYVDELFALSAFIVSFFIENVSEVAA